MRLSRRDRSQILRQWSVVESAVLGRGSPESRNALARVIYMFPALGVSRELVEWGTDLYLISQAAEAGLREIRKCGRTAPLLRFLRLCNFSEKKLDEQSGFR